MTFIEGYHVGLVVADLDATMTEFEDLMGVRWASQQHRDFPVRTRDGLVQAQFRFTYSTHVSGPCLVELIEGPRNTPWDPGDGPWAFHHLGYWADDLAGQSTRLEEAGAVLDATAGEDGDPRGFAYHLLQQGPRVELVDATRRPTFQEWLAGGDFPQA